MGTPWGQDGGFHSLPPSLAAPSRWLAWSRSCGTALWPSTGTKCHTSTSTRGCERRLLRELSRPSGPPPAPHPLSRARRHGPTPSAQPGGWSWGRLAQSLPPSAASCFPIGDVPSPPSKPHCCLKPLQGPLPKSWVPPQQAVRDLSPPHRERTKSRDQCLDFAFLTLRFRFYSLCDCHDPKEELLILFKL